MFVVFRGYAVVNISIASLIVLDILNAIERMREDDSRVFTAREALNMVLISDDFPVPVCES